MYYIPLVNSPLLDELSELDNLDLTASTTKILRPDDYDSWNEVFAQNPDTLDFVLTPGNYTKWGICRINGQGFPDVGRRRTIQIYPPSNTVVDIGQRARLHPVRRPFYQAYVASFQFGINYTADPLARAKGWIIHGLTDVNRLVQDRSDLTQAESSWVLRNCEDIVIDTCLIEGSAVSGVIVLGSNCTVQRCVIRNFQKRTKADTVGVLTQAQRGNPVQNNQFLDNEIYNVGDCVHANVGSLAGETDELLRYSPVGGTIIDGNDLYNEKPYFDTIENIVDIKSGDPDNPCRITNNRMWGHARGNPAIGSSGGSFHMVTFHRGARNWVVENNIIGDGISGYYESVWSPQDLATGFVSSAFHPRGISVKGNLFYNLEYAFGPTIDGQIFNNDVLNVHTLFYKSSDAAKAADDPMPLITGNRLLNVHRIHFAQSDIPERVLGPNHEPPFDRNDNAERSPSWFVYERRRWTGPELELVRVLDHLILPDDEVLYNLP